MTWLGITADLIGILGAVFALLAWLQSRRTQIEIERERERQNQKVQVSLVCGSEKVLLPSEIRRAELTRSEILGRIGMLPKKDSTGRFAIGYLNTPDFFRKMNRIRDGGESDNVLEISCTAAELDQFAKT